MLDGACRFAAGARLERIVMTNEVNAGHRVLGRLIGRELTDAEANEVNGGGPFEANGTSTNTVANGCPNGDSDIDGG
jgi:hypothetical protein